jgi:hypothetical protein
MYQTAKNKTMPKSLNPKDLTLWLFSLTRCSSIFGTKQSYGREKRILRALAQ